jgi:hypothetical protein
MASLIPLSNSPLIKNTKSNLAIVPNQNKLPYNSIKPKNANKVEPTNALVPFVGEDKKQPESKENCCEKSYTKVVKIDKLLNKNLSLRKKQAKISRLNLEKSEFEKREKELEKKKPKQDNKLKLPSTPKLGIFDWIKNYITQTFLGFIFVRLIDFLPKLLKIVPVIISAGEFFINWGGKLLDGFITFVDWGNKIYKSTRTFLGNIGGDGVLKLFDTFTDNLNLVFDLAVVAALSSLSGDLDTGRSSPGKRGYDLKGNRVGKNAQQRYARRYGVDQFKTRFGSKNLTNLPRSGGRGFISRVARNAFVGAAGKSGAKQILKFVKPLVNKIPIIGGLIEFGLSWALGEPIGKAAFKGIGAVLVGAIGTAIGGPIGAFLGSWAGSEAGGVLYDMFFGNKPPKKQKKQKPVRAAGGGQPKISGKTSRPRRTIKKKKPSRTISIMPRKIRPGASIGGEEKVQKVFPDTKKKQTQRPWWDPFGWFGGAARVRQSQSQDESQVKKKSPTTTGKTPNPQEFLLKTYNDIWSKSTDIFGTISTIIFKSILGQSPDKIDYLNVGKGLNSWMRRIFDSSLLAFSGGGEVDARQFFQGEDYTKVIARSVEESVSRDVNATIRKLSQELALRPTGREEMIEENINRGNEGDDGAGGIAGQFSPEGLQGDIYNYLISKGMSDIHALGIMANIHRESGFRPGVSEQGGPGVGLFQYSNEPRKGNFLRAVPNYASNWKGQIDYALTEKGEPSQQYLNTKFSSSQQAADWWMRKWERPAEYIQNDKGPKIHAQYLASLQRFRTKKGYQIPTSADFSGMTRGGDGRFIQGNSGRSKGTHFHIGTNKPGDGSGVATAGFRVIKHFLGKKSIYVGRSGETIPVNSSDEKIRAYISRGQAAHRKTELDLQIGGTGKGNKVAFPLALRNMKYSATDGYGVSADVVGTNAFVGHGRYKPDGTLAPQQLMKLNSGAPDYYAFHGENFGIVPRDGFILKLHKGELFKVIDKDSVDLFGFDLAKEIIDIENKSQLIARAPGIIEKLKSISGYMDYDVQQEVVIMRVPTDPEVVPIPIGRGGGSLVISKIVNNNTFENLEVIG